MTLSGELIKLRALEPEDLSFLYDLENDESVWEVSNTTTPYSKYVLKKYLENSHKDIYEVKQLRLVISNIEQNDTLGFIDLFDFDPKNKRIGIGIVIFSKVFRRKGYATEALSLITNYAFQHLSVHQVYANITEDNIASIKLFENNGFVQTGKKLDWISTMDSYKTEFLYQLIKE